MWGPRIWCHGGAGSKMLPRVWGGSFGKEKEGKLASTTRERGEEDEEPGGEVVGR
jgi:hypothetical protein